MMRKEQDLKLYADGLMHEINQILDSCNLEIPKSEEFQDLWLNLKKLQNRSREYLSPSFVVIVVGPVKSGKSTFVNLIARTYVSPTDFLECTVRPSLIYADESERSLTVYQTEDTEKKAEQMDSILDCLNGLIESDEIKGVKKQTTELTKANIDRYVKLAMTSVKQDQILMTSIKTKGGGLLKNNVFLVDMAGFDGANVNLDTPTYKTIAERADLIVFVQSSNSAISKVSSEFFELLKKKNNLVPVCLVHNVFESAYWREKKSLINDIDEQKKYAVEAIRERYGLSLAENNAYSLNLGKVIDYRDGNYKPSEEKCLAEEDEAFRKTEESMYNLIISQRESIRIKNCIGRINLQREVVLNKLNEHLENMQKVRDKYEKVKSDFEQLKQTESQLELVSDVSINYDRIHELLKNAYYVADYDITQDRYKTVVARKKVTDFLESARSALIKYFQENLDKLEQMKDSTKIQTWFAEMITNAMLYGISDFSIKLELDVCNADFEWKPKIVVEELVPQKPFAYKHSNEEVKNYIKHAYEILSGIPTNLESSLSGYVKDNVFPEMKQKLVEAKQKTCADIVKYGNAEIDVLKSAALNKFIPDIGYFRMQEKALNNLKSALEGLNIEIEL